MIKAVKLAPNATEGDADRNAEREFQRLKVAIHEDLVESLDLSVIGTIQRERLEPEVRAVAAQVCRSSTRSLSAADQQRMLDELMNEVFGLGPLEPLMADGSIADILVNNADEIYVERNGRLELTNVVFADDRHVLRVIQRIVARIGRRIDEVSPMVDARLPDGSRVNAIVPPLSLKGPTLSIRRFGARPLAIPDLLQNRSLTTKMVQFLHAAVSARISFLISGGTGAGKTTMLNALSAAIPGDERLVTIEDSAELTLQHPHVITLETRMANTEGSGEITQRDLVRNSLRMRPDRILVGEVRGAEALDMLQAMNTGHEGSLTTIHANDTRDALARLEMMVAMAGFELPVPVVRQYIASGIKLVAHVTRLKGGVRRMTRISEIVGIENGLFKLEDIYGFEQTGVDDRGNATGFFFCTGYRPKCADRIASSGIEIPDSLFVASRVQV